MKATVVAAALVAVFAVLATPSVAAPVPGDLSASELQTQRDVLGDSFERLEQDYPTPKRNCKAIQDEEHTNESGVYSINSGTGSTIKVYCDMSINGGGYTVIARRGDGSVNFNRPWADYVAGFGNLKGEFFLGLAAIHALAPLEGNENMELWIGLRSHETVFEPYRIASQVYKFARYGTFKVADSNSDYALTVGNYDQSSTAGDSLTSHSGRKFSTFDDDNDDNARTNCAIDNKSGWWFHDCHDSNLNGIWKKDGKDTNNPRATDGIVWQSWKGDQYSLKDVIMAVRPAPIANQ